MAACYMAVLAMIQRFKDSLIAQRIQAWREQQQQVPRSEGSIGPGGKGDRSV